MLSRASRTVLAVRRTVPRGVGAAPLARRLSVVSTARIDTPLPSEVPRLTGPPSSGPGQGEDTGWNRKAKKKRRGFFRLRRLVWAFLLGSSAAATYALHLELNVADPEKGEQWERLFFETFPLRAASRLWGAVFSVEMPTQLREPLYRAWAWAYGSNLEEADRPLAEYRHLEEFFTRALVPGARPIQHADLVSASDGRLLACGTVSPDGRIAQVKGVSYPVEALLAGPPRPTTASGRLHYAVLYLAPGDYHRFHSPADLQLEERTHVAGELFPVHPKMLLRHVPGLFALNERVVLSGTWKHGYMAVVPVGAYNVGSISLTVDPELRTNARPQDAAVRGQNARSFPDKLPESAAQLLSESGRVLSNLEAHAEVATKSLAGLWSAARDLVVGGGHAGDSHEQSDDAAAETISKPGYLDRKTFDPERGRVAKGEELGCFHLGSTVVLVFEAPDTFQFRVSPGSRVRVGQNLGTVDQPEGPPRK